MSYEADANFDASHPNALALYCSDGRFTEAVERLLHSLGHLRLDTVTLPGGPALLDLGSAGFSSVSAAQSGTSFLIRGHKLRHVVLIAHEGCGYYRDRHRLETPPRIVQLQVDDLRAARAWLVGTHAHLDVHMYYARVVERVIRFDPVP